MEFHLTGRLATCLLLSYRTPASSVQHLVPRGLQLATEGSWAFWNIVVCRVEGIRPQGLPAPLGLTYHHVAYRLHVRAQTADGTKREGLFFVRSDADSRLVSHSGNWFSDFKFHSARIQLVERSEIELQVKSRDGRGAAELIANPSSTSTLSPGSCFSTVHQREAVMKYKPEAFSPYSSGRRLHIASVHRDETQWKEKPLDVRQSRWHFLESLGQTDLFLERATRVTPIDYRWSLGKRERLLLED